MACCNAARLWKETYIGIDVLEKNVICVTFGQPLVAIPYVKETIKKYSKFEETIHCIYDDEDIFPKLFHGSNYSPGSLVTTNESGPSRIPGLLTDVRSSNVRT